MIKTENVTKIYKTGGEKTFALNNVSIEVKKGEMVAIKGPSGSGKSTLMHILGGLDKPTSGKIEVNGEDISKYNQKKLSEYRNYMIGFVFQNFNLIPTISVLENITLPSKFYTQKNRKNTTKKAFEILEKLNIADKYKNKPNELSGGQKQRVAIGRALINNPQMILADEPTGNLDSKNGQEVINILKKLNVEDNVTVIIVTHDTAISNQCNKVISMKDGEIVI